MQNEKLRNIAIIAHVDHGKTTLVDEMLKQAQLLPLTGYVHGGCSPIGMKKLFRTVLDSSAQSLPTMAVSAGRIGAQVELAPADLAGLVRAQFAPVTV